MAFAGFSAANEFFVAPSGGFLSGMGGLRHRDFEGGTQPVGAGIDLNFQTGNYVGVTGAPTSFLTTVRASTAYGDDSSGNWTQFAANVPVITNKGLQVWEASTNSIRNNSMQGAAVGTPGTLPTNWTVVNSLTITPNVVGAGTENGIDYIDIQISGTTNGGNGGVFNLGFDASNVIAAANGQAWTSSGFIKLVGGSLAGITGVGFRFATYTSTPTFLNFYGSAPAYVPTGAALGTQRQSNSATITDSTAAFVQPTLAVQTPNGVNTPINVTLRIGWPCLEQKGFATSPIRTTAAAVTRAKDTITLTALPVFGASQTLFTQGTPMVPANATGATFQLLTSMDDTTANNRLHIRRQTTGQLLAFMESGGTTVFNQATTPAYAAGVSTKSAVASALNDDAFVVGGQVIGTVASGAAPPTNYTVVHIGCDQTTGSQFDGYIERVALWPTTRVPNATLQALTT